VIAADGPGGEAPGPRHAIHKVDGHCVHLISAGPREAVPAVLLHGGGFDDAGVSWGALIGPLSARRAVVAPDWPGYGKSAPRGDCDGLAALVAWLERFLDALGIDRADLCGLSMGGGAALLLALERPERVRDLVLVSPYGIAPRAPLHPLSFLASRLALDGPIRALMRTGRIPSRLVAGTMFRDASRLDAALAAEVRAAAIGTPGLSTFARFLRAEVGASGMRTVLLPRLPTLSTPTLIVHGRHDPLIAVASIEAAAAAIPDCRLVLLDTGHFTPREDPDGVNDAVVAFLTRRGPA